ncbi:MAG: thioredoxin-dependent thiol peroxidase [Candidatus Hydrogenedentes bacterium]|nr:thioredoxin-dependent thiol peroxidase [Candidatus Hydrogenedentota bacterium]
MPAVGTKAPAIELPASTGKKVKLSDFKGKPVVVYFYPKDNTPGCTVEAKGFQARFSEFQKVGAVILGISPDSVETHCKFAGKFGLEFILLADEDHQVAENYGVWVEKSMYGKKYMGIQRATFLVDATGKLAQTWPKVKPEGHAEEVLKAIRSL